MNDIYNYLEESSCGIVWIYRFYPIFATSAVLGRSILTVWILCKYDGSWEAPWHEKTVDKWCLLQRTDTLITYTLGRCLSLTLSLREFPSVLCNVYIFYFLTKLMYLSALSYLFKHIRIENIHFICITYNLNHFPILWRTSWVLRIKSVNICLYNSLSQYLVQ